MSGHGKNLLYTCLQRDWEAKAAENVDENLENFLGIRDLELCETLCTQTHTYIHTHTHVYGSRI